MEKVRIRKIIEDIIITQFLNSEMDIVHEEDVSFKELGLDSIDRIELDAMVEQKFNIVIIDYDTESNPQIAIQYKMVNQWKEIAGEQVKAFEHINLGNITVFDGGQNSTGNFLNNVVKTVAPALGVIDQLPIADTLKKLKGDDKK